LYLDDDFGFKAFEDELCDELNVISPDEDEDDNFSSRYCGLDDISL
jgi:hypothetical protein